MSELKVELNKKYRTVDGCDVRIYALDGRGEYCVHGAIKRKLEMDGWVVDSWRINGLNTSHPTGEDLVEVGKWDHIKIDDKVVVVKNAGEKLLRYFAGVNSDGCPTTFNHGASSWSCEKTGWVTSSWENCELWVDDSPAD